MTNDNIEVTVEAYKRTVATNSRLTQENFELGEQLIELRVKTELQEAELAEIRHNNLELKSQLLVQDIPILQTELAEIKKNFSDFRNEAEKTTPPPPLIFKDYLTSFCIFFAGLYSVVCSLWWVYQKLIPRVSKKSKLNITK